MASLSAAQYREAAKRTTLTITQNAYENLNRLRSADICLWTGKSNQVAWRWKTRKVKTISLENAVKINAHAPGTFELDPKHIQYVFVHKKAAAEMDRSHYNCGHIARAIGMPNEYSIIHKVRNGSAKSVPITFARAVDRYFNQFQTTVFDIDNLFSKTVSYLQSGSKSDSPSSTENSEHGTKRPLEHAEQPPSKRAKSSSDSNQKEQSSSAPTPDDPTVKKYSIQAIIN
jgi:hypothetical protein